MSAPAEESDDNATGLPVTGPGERLRAARVASGLELDRVAAQLHLKPGQVEELERDHYDGFAARVFVRGYLRNYARLVALPVESVLQSFDALCPDPELPELKPVGSHRPQVSSRHGVVRLVSWLLLLGILGLFGVWWSGYLELNGESPEVVAPLVGTQGSTPALPLAGEGGAGGLALPAPSGGPEASASPEPEEGENRAPAVDSGDEVALPSYVVEPASDESPAAPPAVPTPEQSMPAGTAAVGTAEIVLFLDGPCWVEVRATDGSFKLLGKFNAGTRRVLGGNPPYRVLLGNASTARLTVGGQPFDLVPHTRKQVARFILDPAAQ